MLTADAEYLLLKFPVNLRRFAGVSGAGARSRNPERTGVPKKRDFLFLGWRSRGISLVGCPRTYSLLIPCFCAWPSQKPAIHAAFRDARKKFPVIFPVIEHT